MESFGRFGEDTTDGVPGPILIMKNLVIANSMAAWWKHDQRGAQPDIYCGQLGGPPVS